MKPEVQLLKGALEQYSPTGSTENIGEYLQAWAEERGMAAELRDGMLVINPEADALLMLGHMDTVDGELTVTLTGANKGETGMGTLSGRGAVDAKGPLCAAMAALAAHETLWGRVSIVAAPDEEGWSHAAKNIRDNWPERPVIILEPSTWQGITLSYMGRLAIRCVTTCPPSHPGHLKPFAAEELCKLWTDLSKDLIVRIRHFHSKNTEGVMSLDIRYRDGTQDDILSRIPKNIEYKILESTQPYTANKNTKLTRAFLHAIRGEDGTPVFKKKTGTSDMNVLGEVWKDAPMLAYGPGDGGLGHTDEERISIDEYLKGIEVLKNALGFIFS